MSATQHRARSAGWREAACRLVPFRARLALINLAAAPGWRSERRSLAVQRLGREALPRFGWSLASHASPLERVPRALPLRLQRGKETNVRIAARILDGTVIGPGEVFSYHHALGRPSRLRGFRIGLELRDGRPSRGVGGGLCQVSNGLYWVAIQAGMQIVERHRHGLDLFPDHRRTVPFGCGATVVWRRTDLRMRNPLGQPVVIRTRVEEGAYRCELRTEADPGIRVEVREEDHGFYREGDAWLRENRILRRITRVDGTLVADEEVAHNRGRVLYEPPPEQHPCSEPSARPSS